MLALLVGPTSHPPYPKPQIYVLWTIIDITQGLHLPSCYREKCGSYIAPTTLVLESSMTSSVKITPGSLDTVCQLQLKESEPLVLHNPFPPSSKCIASVQWQQRSTKRTTIKSLKKHVIFINL